MHQPNIDKDLKSWINWRRLCMKTHIIGQVISLSFFIDLRQLEGLDCKNKRFVWTPRNHVHEMQRTAKLLFGHEHRCPLID